MLDLTSLPLGTSLTRCLLRGSAAAHHVLRLPITLASREPLYRHIRTHLRGCGRSTHPCWLISQSRSDRWR